MSGFTNSAAADQNSAASEYPSTRYGWYVVVVLYLSYTFSFVDSAIIRRNRRYHRGGFGRHLSTIGLACL
jgi:hypothetical protein